MEMAGHIAPTHRRGQGQRHGRIATFADHNITPAEEAELIDYLRHIRSKKRRRRETATAVPAYPNDVRRDIFFEGAQVTRPDEVRPPAMPGLTQQQAMTGIVNHGALYLVYLP